MSQEPTSQAIQTAVAIQIIAGALIAGVVSFGLVAVFLTFGDQPDDPLLGYVAAGFSAVMLVMSLTIPSLVARQQTREAFARAGDDEERARRNLYAAFQTKTIIGFAMLEGAAFFDLVAYMNTARTWVLAIAAALVAIMVSRFPTRGRIENWIENQMQLRDLA